MSYTLEFFLVLIREGLYYVCRFLACFFFIVNQIRHGHLFMLAQKTNTLIAVFLWTTQELVAVDTVVKTITLIPSGTFCVNEEADTEYVIMHKSVPLFLMIAVKENCKVPWKSTTRKHVLAQRRSFWEKIIWSET